MDRNEAAMILKLKRKQLHMTQTEVAKQAGIKQQAYQRFESGERDIRNASFSLACKVLLTLQLTPVKFHLGGYHLSEIETDCSPKKHHKKSCGKK